MIRRRTVHVPDTRQPEPTVVTHEAVIPDCPYPLPTESEPAALGLVAIHGGEVREAVEEQP